MDGGAELVFVGAGLGLDGVGHGGLGEPRQFDLDVGALDTEGVAGEGVAKLGDGAEIAGMEFEHFDGLAALHDGQMREALLALAGVVLDGAVVLDDAADDREEADAAGEGVGHGFEDEQGAGFRVGDGPESAAFSVVGIRAAIAGGYGGGRGGFYRDGRALGGRGRVDLDEVKKVVGGHIGSAAGEQDGEDAIFANGLV